ncbi:MAG TPA: hypothetical protein DCM67_05920 [Propionibacteriaceae bacterium]|nr:hypothetical protein [Propionibacteriaceae bacterium]
MTETSWRQLYKAGPTWSRLRTCGTFLSRFWIRWVDGDGGLMLEHHELRPRGPIASMAGRRHTEVLVERLSFRPFDARRGVVVAEP